MKVRSRILLLLLAFLPLSAFGQTVLLLSTGSSSLNSTTQTTLQNAGYSVTIGSQYSSFNASELVGIDVVLLFPNNNWSSSVDMPLTAQTALKDFVSNGGGLITGEWTNWMNARGLFSNLTEILPVVATTQYTGGSSLSYTQATADPVINNDLPTAFAFSTDSFAGVESMFTAKSGATVFYTSSGGANGAGVVGWDVGAGRVLQFSTVAGPNELSDPHYSLLFQNTVQWAAVPEPSSAVLFALGLGLIAWIASRRR